MRLRALLETESLGLRLIGGENELDRAVRGVMTTDLRDPSRYLSGGELVLTGLAWRREAADSEPFVRILAAEGVAGLAAGEAEQGMTPDDLVEACARHRMPLFSVSEAVAFASITEHIVRQVSTERAGDLAAVVDRHRRLMSSGPAGGGPDAVLDLLGSDLDLPAWVLSPTGRRIAGPSEPEGPALSSAARARLAGAHLAAVRAGRPGPERATVDGTVYSLFPIRGGPEGGGAGRGDVRETVLSDWLLVVAADAGDWPSERLDLLEGVTQLVAAERQHRDADRAVRRRLAQEVLELVRAGAQPSEVAARLRVATPVLLPGLGSAPHWQVVVASVEWRGAGADRIDGGRVAQTVLEEALVDPRVPGSAAVDRNAVAHTGGEAVALVPLPSPAETDGAGGGGERPGHRGGHPRGAPNGAGGGSGRAGEGAGRDGSRQGGADERANTPREAQAQTQAQAHAQTQAEADGLSADGLLNTLKPAMERALSDDGRLTLGVSAVVHSAEGLRGALEEARHARRVAAARAGRVCAAGHQELASHVLLLPFVPDDVRRAFTSRLLDPLREYDRRHRSELVGTLDAFLSADGSWTRCASGLHVHVNTLRYRVGRIEQLTGRDLSRLEDKLDFFLALRMS